MYGASIVGYKVNQKEERRRVVFHTVPFTAKNIVKVEIPFWIQSNTNKLDREYMRNHADIKLEMFKNAIIKKPKSESS